MMAAEPKWIRFVEKPPLKSAQKTKRWHVETKGGDEAGFLIGEIIWDGRWRCYAFAPVENVGTVYEKTCLRDIASFCEQQTHGRYKKPAASGGKERSAQSFRSAGPRS
jgi:hypothetical protein